MRAAAQRLAQLADEAIADVPPIPALAPTLDLGSAAVAGSIGPVAGVSSRGRPRGISRFLRPQPVGLVAVVAFVIVTLFCYPELPNDAANQIAYLRDARTGLAEARLPRNS